jgi:hypothetical protein
VERVGFGVGFMVKVFLCFFKKKRYKYEDELGSKKIQQPSPVTASEMLVCIA